MKFSLLYKTPENSSVTDIIYDLSVDRSVSNLTDDKKKAGLFLDVLSRPLTNKENIEYRQQIYLDLKENPELLSELRLLFGRYDRIRSDWQEMRLSTASGEDRFNTEALLEHTYSSLKVTSMFPGTIASFYESIASALDKYEIKSPGLIDLKERCTEMINNDSLSEIVRIAGLFRYHSPEYFDFEMAIRLDEALGAESSVLTGISEHKEKKDTAKLLGIFKKKTEEKVVLISPDDDKNGDDSGRDCDLLLYRSLSDIDKALSRITNEIYEDFFGLSFELAFYETATELFGKTKDLGLPCNLPEILPSEDDTIIVKDLYDLFLASKGHTKDEIVENDVCLSKETGGMIVKGDTDSGKTVFLRSVGTAILFAQAGLPILCEKAQISIRQAMFSHFSSAEEAFVPGDTAGRFESEAKELAKIIDGIVPDSFVMLNETFQTTSYKEGTEAIAVILDLLPKMKTKYIFVTHLTGLFDIMKKENVFLAKTDTERKYKVTGI